MSYDIVHPEFSRASNGKLWWELVSDPGAKRPYGAVNKICAYLASTKDVGDTFTTQELREALGDNRQEHLQRRLRELRGSRLGWSIDSQKYDRSLGIEIFKIRRIGWHPALGNKPKNIQSVDARTRALVLERDGSRCQLCGVGAGEPYPGNPDLKATMTIGHVVPQESGGTNSLDNLRTECSLCNEPKRSEGGQPETAHRMIASVRNLNTKDLKKIYEWISADRRMRDDVDALFDRYRIMSPGDKEKVRVQVSEMLGKNKH
ncbi:HNH endonuclease [Corynebacterium variabile]|uniref:HNH endonuclease n=1 Tax=Corynebacterium variabile TaxID=1727 RepID=UPI003BB64B7C